MPARAALIRDQLKVALTRFPRLYHLSRRPYALARFLARRPHDSDYAAFGLFADRNGLFLDIGANAGMSALSFRIYKRKNEILSIEPNPYHAADLRLIGRVVGRFSYLICAVGEQSGEVALHIPVYRGVPLTTEASLVLDEVLGSPSLRQRLGARMDGPDFTIAETLVAVRRIDDLDLNPDFVKLDLQGFEQAALLGMRDTIRKSQPVILVESPDDAVHGLMAEHGYQAKAYRASSGGLSSELDGVTNVLFIPGSH